MKNLLLVKLDTGNIAAVIEQVRLVANVILGIISVLVVFLAIWIGYQFASADNEEKRKEAKTRLVYAIIGVIIAIGLVIVLNTADLASVFNMSEEITMPK